MFFVFRVSRMLGCRALEDPEHTNAERAWLLAKVGTFPHLAGLSMQHLAFRVYSALSLSLSN